LPQSTLFSYTWRFRSYLRILLGQIDPRRVVVNKHGAAVGTLEHLAGTLRTVQRMVHIQFLVIDIQPVGSEHPNIAPRSGGGEHRSEEHTSELLSRFEL